MISQLFVDKWLSKLLEQCTIQVNDDHELCYAIDGDLTGALHMFCNTDC